MITFNALRTLARSPYWQVVYSRSKEVFNISLFENKIDFTPLQIAFLQWLEVYHSLEIDLASKKELVSREIIDDDIRCDAYLHWRQLTENKSEKEVSALKVDSEATDGSVRFIQRPRKRK